MKKSGAYFLLILMVLNILGYYGVFLGIEYRHELSMNNRMDESDYSLSETITFKIPLVRPYVPYADAFSPAAGQFEYGGESYRMVRQKFAKDTLTIVCLKDTEQSKIDTAFTDYVNSFADRTAPVPVNAKVFHALIKDYIFYTTQLSVQSGGWSLERGKNQLSVFLKSSYTSSIIHPPERSAVV